MTINYGAVARAIEFMARSSSLLHCWLTHDHSSGGGQNRKVTESTWRPFWASLTWSWPKVMSERLGGIYTNRWTVCTTKYNSWSTTFLDSNNRCIWMELSLMISGKYIQLGRWWMQNTKQPWLVSLAWVTHDSKFFHFCNRKPTSRTSSRICIRGLVWMICWNLTWLLSSNLLGGT